MSKLLNLIDFAKAGLNSDIMPWALPGDYLTAIRNIRIKDGKLSPTPVAEVLSELPESFFPAFMLFVDSSTGYYWIIAGDDSVGTKCVYAYNYLNYYDISTGPYNGLIKDDWQGIMLSGVPIINHRDNFPQYWAPQSVASPLVDLPWDATKSWREADESAVIFRGHKQFMFALDLRSGLETIRDGVRWSAPADINSVPPTWDPLDTTNVAGFTTLGTDGGKIIDGLSMRDAFVVYREKSVAIFDYVGGQFVWQIRQLSTTAGLVSSNTIIEVNGFHYFIGDGDIYVNNGNEIVSAIHGRIREAFTGNYNAQFFYRSYVVRNDTFSEAWFCVPSATSEYPDLAYVFNWRDNTWSTRDIVANAYAGYGKRNVPTPVWEAQDVSWDLYNAPWGRTITTPLANALFAVTPPEGANAGKFVELDSPNMYSFEIDSIIERISYTIEGIQSTTTINRLYPRMVGPGSVYIQLGSQEIPGAPIAWKERELFNPAVDRSLTTRTTGQFHCFRVESADDQPWEFGGFDIEYVMAGGR